MGTMPVVRPEGPVDEAFTRLIAREVRRKRGEFVRKLRYKILALLKEGDVRGSRISTASARIWQCRTATFHSNVRETKLFKPVVKFFKDLVKNVDSRISIKCALVGYSSGDGTEHPDRAKGIRLVISLLELSRKISFFQGHKRKSGGPPRVQRSFTLEGDEAYLATSLARGAVGPKSARKGQVTHQAEGPPKDIALVVDFVVPGKETDFLDKIFACLEGWDAPSPHWFEAHTTALQKSFLPFLTKAMGLKAAVWNDGEWSEEWSWAYEGQSEEIIQCERDAARARTKEEKVTKKR